MFARIPVPTPFAVGDVNAYVAGRTVVDPGPDSEEAWSTLVDGLETESLAPGDVERVIVTHSHPDHFGLAGRFREEGAQVLASPPAAGIMADFPGHLEYEQDFFTDFLSACGLSPETAHAVTGLPEPFLQYAPSVETDRELVAGDTVDVNGITLTVDEVDGHAPGELIFAFDQDGERHAIVGDNVLGDISPNPVLQPPPDPGGERPRVLPAYNRSLRRLAGEDYDRFLVGHRDEVEEPSQRIEEILAEHEERSSRVHELLADGPVTPADIMDGLFPGLPATEKFAGMSEAVGHLDVLEERGDAVRRKEGGLFVYEQAD